jgi:hypothetical protein
MLPERGPGKAEIDGVPANGASGRRRRTGGSIGMRVVCRLAQAAARV